jgi:hypothetical protein
LAGAKRLEGDHNVVRASEHEGLVAQTTYYLQYRADADDLRSGQWYDHTLLHVHEKRVAMCWKDFSELSEYQISGFRKIRYLQRGRGTGGVPSEL